MTIVYPLLIPAAVQMQAVRWSQFTVVAESESPFDLTRQTQVFAGQRWEALVTVHPTRNPATAGEARAWFVSLNGKQGTFALGDPLGVVPRGTPLGVPLVDGVGQAGRVVNTKGWTPDATGLLLAGDWIEIVGVLYMVMADVDADAGGLAAIDIWPDIRGAPPNEEPVVTTNARGIFALTSNRSSWEQGFRNQQRFAFSCKQVI